MSNVIVTPPRYKAEVVIVADEGEDVILRVGNAALRFPYEDALSIAALLRLHAKRAKATAGDHSRNWRALGIIDGHRQ